MGTPAGSLDQSRALGRGRTTQNTRQKAMKIRKRVSDQKIISPIKARGEVTRAKKIFREAEVASRITEEEVRRATSSRTAPTSDDQINSLRRYKNWFYMSILILFCILIISNINKFNFNTEKGCVSSKVYLNLDPTMCEEQKHQGNPCSQEGNFVNGVNLSEENLEALMEGSTPI